MDSSCKYDSATVVISIRREDNKVRFAVNMDKIGHGFSLAILVGLAAVFFFLSRIGDPFLVTPTTFKLGLAADRYHGITKFTCHAKCVSVDEMKGEVHVRNHLPNGLRGKFHQTLFDYGANWSAMR